MKTFHTYLFLVFSGSALSHILYLTNASNTSHKFGFGLVPTMSKTESDQVIKMANGSKKYKQINIIYTNAEPLLTSSQRHQVVKGLKHSNRTRYSTFIKAEQTEKWPAPQCQTHAHQLKLASYSTPGLNQTHYGASFTSIS